MKKLFYFSLAILVAIILAWFGSKFLFAPGDKIGSAELFIMGVILVVSGVSVLNLSAVGRDWRVGLGLLAVGIYFFARAAGVVEMPWLARVLGTACWAVAFLMLYRTWPRQQSAGSSKEDDSDVINT